MRSFTFFATCLGALCLVAFTVNAQGADNAKPRVVGGKIATKQVRRRLALITVFSKDGGAGSCTGSIYDKQWILSAAHCFDSEGSSSDVDVPESFAYISPKSTSPNARRFYFEEVHIHKGYNPSRVVEKHDIAFVKLAREIPDSKYYPVVIGTEPEEDSKVLGAGYGALNEDGDEASYAMQTDLIAKDFFTCEEFEREDVADILRKKLHVCAVSIGFPDEGKTDTCYGDSGGPLFKYNEQGEIEQYGITSFSMTGCAEVGGTPWYVRASYYKEMLDAIVDNGSHRNFRVRT